MASDAAEGRTPAQLFGLVLKGWAMGAANVIPGVSGGTIAFVTGIYEELIHSIKSFDATAVGLLLGGRFRAFARHINLGFLVAIFLGVAISVFSLAFLLTWLFENEEFYTMSFFFGLILASVVVVGKQVKRWNATPVISLLAGTGIAVALAFFEPATENTSMFYVFLCGIAAVCSMILPGLSGSYILLIMGNYVLILNAVEELDFGLLLPLLVGCVVGLILFSHLLDFVFRRAHDATVALLTGFVLGSLLIIWPWKNTLTEAIGGEEKAVGYEWFAPSLDGTLLAALLMIAIGAAAVLLIERMGATQPSGAGEERPTEA